MTSPIAAAVHREFSGEEDRPAHAFLGQPGLDAELFCLRRNDLKG